MIEHHNDPLSANLGVLHLADLPFQVRRIYWISDFKEHAIRGQHAHKNLTQVMIVLSGKIELVLFDGESSKTICLVPGENPIVVNPGQWRIMKNADPGTVILVLASHEYDENDYIRNWNEYLKWYKTRS